MQTTCPSPRPAGRGVAHSYRYSRNYPRGKEFVEKGVTEQKIIISWDMSIEEHDKEGEGDRNEQRIEELRLIQCKGLRKEEIEDRLKRTRRSRKI